VISKLQDAKIYPRVECSMVHQPKNKCCIYSNVRKGISGDDTRKCLNVINIKEIPMADNVYTDQLVDCMLA
jgi:hypothetical protein